MNQLIRKQIAMICGYTVQEQGGYWIPVHSISHSSFGWRCKSQAEAWRQLSNRDVSEYVIFRELIPAMKRLGFSWKFDERIATFFSSPSDEFSDDSPSFLTRVSVAAIKAAKSVKAI